jgi:hypothetical protein
LLFGGKMSKETLYINNERVEVEIEVDPARYFIASAKYKGHTFNSRCCFVAHDNLPDYKAKNAPGEGAVDNLRRRIEKFEKDGFQTLLKLEQWNAGKATIS